MAQPVEETPFVRHNANRIVDLLGNNQPMTLSELAGKTGVNYYSTRKALLLLEDEGRVKPASNAHRNVKYTLTHVDGPNRIIPLIGSQATGKHKMHRLAEAYKIPMPAAAQAVMNLPLNVTKLFRSAEQLHKGVKPTSNIVAIKHEMERDLQSLKSVVEIMEQILNNTRVWNPASLAKFPDDVDYDSELIQEAHAHYFRQV